MEICLIIISVIVVDLYIHGLTSFLLSFSINEIINLIQLYIVPSKFYFNFKAKVTNLFAMKPSVIHLSYFTSYKLSL